MKKNEEMKRMKEWHHKTLYNVFDGKQKIIMISTEINTRFFFTSVGFLFVAMKDIQMRKY